MFAAILGPVAGLAKTWLEGKQKKAQLKSQVELTKLEATKQKRLFQSPALKHFFM